MKPFLALVALVLMVFAGNGRAQTLDQRMCRINFDTCAAELNNTCSTLVNDCHKRYRDEERRCIADARHQFDLCARALPPGKRARAEDACQNLRLREKGCSAPFQLKEMAWRCAPRAVGCPSRERCDVPFQICMRDAANTQQQQQLQREQQQQQMLQQQQLQQQQKLQQQQQQQQPEPVPPRQSVDQVELPRGRPQAAPPPAPQPVRPANAQGKLRLGVGLWTQDIGLPDRGAVMIVSVNPGSVAEATGLRAKDQLLEVGNVTMTQEKDVVRVLDGLSPGAQLPIRIRRGRQELQLVARFPAPPPSPAPAAAMPESAPEVHPLLAALRPHEPRKVNWKDLSANRKDEDPNVCYSGLVVLDARPKRDGSWEGGIWVNSFRLAPGSKDTPARRAGLIPGDNIVGIDGTSTAGMSAEEVHVRSDKPLWEPLQLIVMRRGEKEPREITVSCEAR